MATQLVEARPLRDAAREQQRAHAAVGEQRGRGEPLAEALSLVHGRSLPEADSVPRRRTTDELGRRDRGGPAAGAVGRCRPTTATRRTRRHRAIATRSPRRSGGRACSPSASVDSQIGPSTAATSASAAPGPVDRRAERRQRDDRRAARRTARAGSARSCRRRGRPGGRRVRGRGGRVPRASRLVRRGTGRARSRGGSGGGPPGWRRAAPAAPGRTVAGRGDGSPNGPTGNPPPTSSVSKSGLVAAQQGERGEAAPDRVAPRVDRAELRSDMEVDAARHGAGPPARRRPRSPPPAPSRSSRTSSRRRPTASPACVSGATSGLSRNRTSMGGRSPRPRPARRAIAARAVAPRPRFDRDPAQRWPLGRRPDRRPQVGVGLADALERDPLVRQPGRRRQRPLAARDDVRAPPPARPTAAMIAGTSFALTEYWRIHGSGNAARSSPPAASSAAPSVT